jgi:hypothetical protein
MVEVPVSILNLNKEQVELASDFLRSFNPQLYSTRAGSPALVLTDKGGGFWHLLGVYHNGNEWVPAKWMPDGKYPGINEKVKQCGLDLIMVDTVVPELELA